MPRTKSRSSHTAASSRKGRSNRSGSKSSSTRNDDTKVRRYLDFIRAILGTSPRNGR
ncbi:MAG TPA: hypothetical protein VFU59_10825 [Candidatus Eisenbacteria bacterium]|nr:hypothetical protein [Candidatus Eisenbacteria bacterium]